MAIICKILQKVHNNTTSFYLVTKKTKVGDKI